MNAPHKPGEYDVPNVPDISERPATFGTAHIAPPMAKTPEEREAAWNRLAAAMDEGWRSDGTRMTRDEMHER